MPEAAIVADEQLSVDVINPEVVETAVLSSPMTMEMIPVTTMRMLRMN